MIELYTREDKLNAVKFFLNETLNTKYSLEIRKEEMERVGKRWCSGHPEWSDIYGINLRPIDDISYTELLHLIDSI